MRKSNVKIATTAATNGRIELLKKKRESRRKARRIEAV